MTQKKKATPKSSPKQTCINDNSISAQRKRLLARLRRGSADTITLRSADNIMMPASRVHELREMGYEIVTTRVSLRDDSGRPHNVAQYSLLAEARRNKLLPAVSGGGK